jgi:hypothetical protein
MRKRSKGHLKLKETLDGYTQAEKRKTEEENALVKWINRRPIMVDYIQDLKYGEPKNSDDPTMQWLRERLAQRPESIASR